MVRLLPFLLCASVASAQLRSPRQFSADRHLRVGTTQPSPQERTPHVHKRATINFSNPKAADYLVDGTKIPDVDFDVGPSWSGLMPISGNANETRKLFFWFWPTTNQEHTNDLVFWTNGVWMWYEIMAYTGTPNYSGIKDECAIWDMIYEAAITVNPNFNIYRIFDVWPVLWDILGFPGSFNNQQSPIYFNRTEVQDAIHAPHINWDECSSVGVFVNGTDNSVPVMLSVMPNVIEKSERTVVMHGGIDYVLIAEGTRIAIQNMTWNGKQGFQKPIQSESFVIEGFGVLGSMHQERNLTYVEVDLAGHMMPQYAPWAAYKTLSYLLGREELTDHTNDAALYPSAYELYGPGSREKLPRRNRMEL
ncbi:hypothetical protein FRC11_004764 [Ceratobasidium sp. 423]|nr:hypothetical protein FRC11_004764 [Ceratobasidium sp. 423]